MHDNNLIGAKAASNATLLTRKHKEEHDLATLQNDWQERTKSLNFDAQMFMDNHHQQTNTDTIFTKLRTLFNKSPSEQEAATHCVQVAIETLSQRTSVFSERELRKESLKHSLVHEKSISLDAIAQAISAGKITNKLYASFCENTQQIMLTTPWLLTLEAESITRIENNKGVIPPITSGKKVTLFQQSIDKNNDMLMTNSQKQAMRLILTSTDRYIAIQGYAGVAKTTMLAQARLLIEQSGYNLRGITVASFAANELQTKAGIKTDVFPIVHQELKSSSPGSLSKTVFIIDEASMLSSSQGHELIKRIELTGARLVLVGDKAQLPSVNSGRLFSLTQEYDIKTALMDEGEPYIQVTLKAKTLEAVQQRFVAYYQRGDSIRFNQDITQNKIKQGHYYTVGQITKTNRTNNTLPLVNKEGETQQFALKYLPQYKTHSAAFERIIEIYQVRPLELMTGDKVMRCRNFKTDNISNGQRATVASHTETELVFNLEKGSQITLNKNHPSLKHLDYGYVLTNYKVQGKDAHQGIGLMESQHRFSATLKNFYVQISRAVYGMTLVTDDKQSLIKAIEKNQDIKPAALDIISSKQLTMHNLKFKNQISIQPTIDKKIQHKFANTAKQILSNSPKTNTVQELSFSKANNIAAKTKELTR